MQTHWPCCWVYRGRQDVSLRSLRFLGLLRACQHAPSLASGSACHIDTCHIDDIGVIDPRRAAKTRLVAATNSETRAFAGALLEAFARPCATILESGKMLNGDTWCRSSMNGCRSRDDLGSEMVYPSSIMSSPVQSMSILYIWALCTDLPQCCLNGGS